MTHKQRNSEGVVLSFDVVSEDNLGSYVCVAVNLKDVAYAHVELGKISEIHVCIVFSF